MLSRASVQQQGTGCPPALLSASTMMHAWAQQERQGQGLLACSCPPPPVSAPGCADNTRSAHCGRAPRSTGATATTIQRLVLTGCMHINTLHAAHAAAGLVARVKPSAAAAAGQQRRPVAPLSAAAGAAGSSSDSPNMGPVLTAVGVACMGAFAFGYHLGVVNGPLEAIAKELGFAGNQALAGLVGFVLCTGSICTVGLLVSGPRLPAVHRRSDQLRRSCTGTGQHGADADSGRAHTAFHAFIPKVAAAQGFEPVACCCLPAW